MFAAKIDKNKLYIPGSEIFDYTGKETEDTILEPIPSGLWHPKWEGEWNGEGWVDGRWVEGLTSLEIAARSGLPQTLPEAKTYIQQQIIELAAQKQERLIAGYSAAERDTWDKKQDEAKAYVDSDGISQAKYLRIEAIAFCGASTESQIRAATMELARTVLRKADELFAVSAAISGTRARKWAEVEAMSDVQKVLGYPVDQGW